MDSSDSDRFYGDEQFHASSSQSAKPRSVKDPFKYSEESIFAPDSPVPEHNTSASSSKGVVIDLTGTEDSVINSTSNSLNTSNNNSNNSSSDRHPHDDDRLVLSMETLGDMSIAELRSLMASLGVSDSGCLYRADIVNRLRESDRLVVID